MSNLAMGEVVPTPTKPLDLSIYKSSVLKAISPLVVESVPKVKILLVVSYPIKH
jgi:hypothetical protein